MSRIVSDKPYLDYRITVEELTRANHVVRVCNAEGVKVFEQSGILEEKDALLVGQAWVHGVRSVSIRSAAPFEVNRPVPPAPVVAKQPDHLMIRVRDVLQEAGGLVSEEGENEEYDRALVELCGRLMGLDLSDDGPRQAILAMLRVL